MKREVWNKGKKLSIVEEPPQEYNGLNEFIKITCRKMLPGLLGFSVLHENFYEQE